MSKVKVPSFIKIKIKAETIMREVKKIEVRAIASELNIQNITVKVQEKADIKTVLDRLIIFEQNVIRIQPTTKIMCYEQIYVEIE